MTADKPQQPRDPLQWLADHGDYLFRFALARLRDEASAEDAVQETLLAAIEGAGNYRGEGSVRTWLVGILKHKIVDQIRRQARLPNRDGVTDEASPEENGPIAAMFDPRGEWAAPLRDWGDPEAALEQKRFWEAFALCLRQLPKYPAMLFSLRELSEMSTDEICEVLGISPANSWVILYRARQRMRQCLETHWLGTGAPSKP